MHYNQVLINSLLMSLLSIICFGCATTRTVIESKGEGYSLAFEAPYDAVWESLPAAIEQTVCRSAEIEADKVSGRMLVNCVDPAAVGFSMIAQGLLWADYGQVMVVFVNSESVEKTRVEITAKSKNSLDMGDDTLYWSRKIYMALSERYKIVE